MKKLGILILVMASIIGLSQCKKKVDTVTTGNDAGDKVHITLNVGGSRHYIYLGPDDPHQGEVLFEKDDVIFVGNGGKYIGTLTCNNSGVFSGDITSPVETDYLHFYFIGGFPLDQTLTPGSTTSFTLDISDQTYSRLDYVPTLSYGHTAEFYEDGETYYECELENKCGIVAFMPSIYTSEKVTIDGMKTKAKIDFENPGIFATEDRGSLSPWPDDVDVLYAMLLPQDAVTNPTVTIRGFRSTIESVPEITANVLLDYDHGVDISMEYSTFSVGEDSKVIFSPGNLQATTKNLGTTWSWSFADPQYSRVGNAVANNKINGKGTVSENGTVDLFCWSSNQNQGSSYGINNSTSTSYGSPYFKDWGAKKINNGRYINSYEANYWRTPSQEEWNYLFTQRENADQKWGWAIIDETYDGIVILPDDWDYDYEFWPQDWNSFYTYECEDGYQWTLFEDHGAIFLPLGSYRVGNTVNTYYTNNWYYRTSTPAASNSTYTNAAVKFNTYNLVMDPMSQVWCYYGCFVRLIHDVD